MVQKLTRILGLIALALTLAFAVLPASQGAAQTNNPTAQAVKEADLLNKLKDGATINGRITIPDKNAANLIQPEGREWQTYRRSTLPTIGAIAILGMLLVLVAFYAIRGRIMIDAGPSGEMIERFNSFDRLVHWLTAGSFIILGLTGLNITFGKSLLLPIIGEGAFANLTVLGKTVHNYVGFAFMVGVVLTFLIWVKDNIPHPRDINWLMQFGGLFSKHNHPPATRFNAGQKGIFWSVVIGGVLMSISGLHLVFPDQVSGGIGELQFQSQLHGIAAMVMVAIILAHIYIGSVGMEGAKEAMTTGEVDLNWAKEHHSLWVEKVLAEKGDKIVHPANKVQPAE